MAQTKDLHPNQTSLHSKRIRNMDRIPSGPPPTYEQVEKLDSLPQALPQAVPHSYSHHHEGIETGATDLDATKHTSLLQVSCTDPLGHQPKTRYGTVGIIAGIVFFPWGLFWTKCDSRVVCKSCDTVLRPNHCQVGNRSCSRKIMVDGGCGNGSGGGYGSCGSKRRKRHCGGGRC